MTAPDIIWNKRICLLNNELKTLSRRARLINEELQKIDARIITETIGKIEYEDVEEEIQYVPKGMADKTLSMRRSATLEEVSSVLESKLVRLEELFLKKILPQCTANDIDSNEIAKYVVTAIKEAFAVEDGKRLSEEEKQCEINLSSINPQHQIEKMKEADYLNETEFEYFIAELFEKMGYDIYVTKQSNDFGIDVIARNEFVGIGIQCKHLQGGFLGISAVQEVVAGLSHYLLDKGIVITNRYFTPSAKKLAEENKILLIDRIYLEKLLKESYDGAKK